MQADNAWIFNVFTKIRLQALSSSNTFTTMAMAVACVIVVFLMIKTANDLMSDEQSSGFGGVTLWQLLRPILILVCIQNFGMVIGPIDSVADRISTSITGSITSMDVNYVIAAKTQTQENLAALTSRAWAAAGLGERTNVKYSDLSRNEKHKLTETIIEQAVSDLNYVKNPKKQQRKIAREIRRNGGFVVDENGKITMGGDEMYEESESDGFFEKLSNIGIEDIVMWAFKYAFPIMICSGELLLCVLAMLGPWVLVVSLLPWAKTGFIDFVMKYFQISFWKPCGAVVYWATTNALSSLKIVRTNDAMSFGNSIGKDIFGNSMASFMMVVLGIAGIMMLMKVPSIAATIIPAGGASVGDAAGGGFAMAAGMARGIANAPGNTFKAGKGIADIAHGIQGQKQGKANAANIASMSGTLSGMSNTLSGMANPPQK